MVIHWKHAWISDHVNKRNVSFIQSHNLNGLVLQIFTSCPHNCSVHAVQIIFHMLIQVPTLLCPDLCHWMLSPTRNGKNKKLRRHPIHASYREEHKVAAPVPLRKKTVIHLDLDANPVSICRAGLFRCSQELEYRSNCMNIENISVSVKNSVRLRCVCEC